MSNHGGWSGPKVTRLREWWAGALPTPCGLCGLVVTAEDQWVIGHIKSRGAHPELAWDLSNMRIEHRACSNRTGQQGVIDRAKAEALREASLSPQAQPLPPAAPSLAHTPETTSPDPLQIRDELTWSYFCQVAPEWLQPVLEPTEDAAPPLAMTPPHPEAVGTYGQQACQWMEENLTERGRPLVLRWWQRLAIYRQLEHRADGSLCWRFILESTPRQVGKSTRLRGMALWRIAVGPDLFEPEQLVMGTGRALSICREIMRKGYPWADSQDGWSCKRGMTEPEISYQELNRWIVRSKDDTTGYSPCLALVDESWDVAPSVIDDDLEPSMTERLSPQLLLTSTAHRKATSLMRGRMSNALSSEDGETLLLWWGAPPGADIADPETQRLASPYWSKARAAVAAGAYARALSGQEDPEADNLSPMDAYLCQILNQWPLKQRTAAKGELVMSPADYALRTALQIPTGPPKAVAVESWFGEGACLAMAWKPDNSPAVVSVATYPTLSDLEAALEARKGTTEALAGFEGKLLLGQSLEGLKSPFRVSLEKARAMDALAYLARTEWEHLDSPALEQQITTARVLQGESPRLAPGTRSDALKAAFWAVEAANRKSIGKPRIIISI